MEQQQEVIEVVDFEEIETLNPTGPTECTRGGSIFEIDAWVYKL